MVKLSKFKSVKDYFDSQSADTLKVLFALRSIIQETLPESEELLNYEMPAYPLIKGGKRDKQIMIAGYKTFIGFYVGNNIVNNFEHQLANYSIGKASIQFPLNKPLPKELIIQIILYKKNLVCML